MPAESVGLSAYSLMHPEDIPVVGAIHQNCEYARNTVVPVRSGILQSFYPPSTLFIF